MYLFFDVETTGLAHSSDILEFAGILTDDNMNIIRVINEYYLYPAGVPAGASKVNGLTTDKLQFLADSEFIDCAQDIYDLFSDPQITLVGHNIISYDIPVVVNNLNRCGYAIDIPDSRCKDTLLMVKQMYKGSHKLSSAISYFISQAGETMKYIDDLYEKSEIIQQQNKDTNMKFHGALYDTFVTYALYTLIR